VAALKRCSVDPRLLPDSYLQLLEALLAQHYLLSIEDLSQADAESFFPCLAQLLSLRTPGVQRRAVEQLSVLHTCAVHKRMDIAQFFAAMRGSGILTRLLLAMGRDDAGEGARHMTPLRRLVGDCFQADSRGFPALLWWEEIGLLDVAERALS